MKKYITPMLILSVLGTALSCVLLYQHYFPDFELGFISCKSGLSNPCVTVGQSKYSSIFGIPIAAFGIIYFMLLTFLILVADYAKGAYYKIFCGIGLHLIAVGLIVDVILGILMIQIGRICELCVATYAINLAIFIILIFFIKNNFPMGEIKESLKSFFTPEDSDGKAVLALSMIFVFAISAAVLAGSNIIKFKSGFHKNQDADKFISSFYNQKEEKIKFPESNLTIGKSDAKVKIYIFTDFLCSACRKLYEIEKNIIAKYEGKIEIVYFHYPLDKSCNNDMEETIYPNSCLASKSMYAAARAEFFEEYSYIHFLNYNNYKDGFEIEHIYKNLTQAAAKFKIKPEAIEKFKSIMNNKDIDQISEHIELAKKLKIESTPTIYISGRKIVGAPGKELLESIIDRELGKCQNCDTSTYFDFAQ